MISDFDTSYDTSSQHLPYTRNELGDFECNPNVNKTMFNHHHHRQTYIDVFSLWKKFPLAIMEKSSKIGLECKESYNRYLRGLKRNNIKSLKMFDASAKLPPGILSGNVNQYGDFDECLSLDEAQYCLAEVDLTQFWSETRFGFENLIHSNFAIRETFSDPGHRVPGFTMIRWGFCIPRECTHTDLEVSIRDNFHVPARIRPQMCQEAVKEVQPLSWAAKAARLLFILILFTVASATLTVKIWPDVESSTESSVIKAFLAFALQRNWKKMQTISPDKSKDIKSVDGVRALGALALLITHKSMALLYNPYINRTAMSENLGQEWCVIGRTAIIYTDGFMLISGLLNANALLSDLTKYNSMRFKEKFISRIFRISPNLIAVILFCTYILPFLGSGPLWPLVVNHHAELCKNHMWRNMFYIHNYYGFENMCLTHTHQLGIDMQLFVFTPVIVYILWRSRYLGLLAIGTIAAFSTFLRAWATWTYNLSHFVHFGIPISRLFNTANLSYILPTHRATIYLIGVGMAYLLRYPHDVPVLIKRNKSVLWPFLIGMGLIPMMAPYHMAKVGYSFNTFDAVIYGAFSPIFWGVAIAWTLYASNNGLGGWFGNFLCWEKFKYFTKISYAVYLVQFPVFFYYVGKRRYAEEYSPHMIFPIFEAIVIISLSIILTLFVEMPFLTIRGIILDKSKIAKKSS